MRRDAARGTEKTDARLTIPSSPGERTVPACGARLARPGRVTEPSTRTSSPDHEATRRAVLAFMVVHSAHTVAPLFRAFARDASLLSLELWPLGDPPVQLGWGEVAAKRPAPVAVFPRQEERTSAPACPGDFDVRARSMTDLLERTASLLVRCADGIACERDREARFTRAREVASFVAETLATLRRVVRSLPGNEKLVRPLIGLCEQSSELASWCTRPAEAEVEIAPEIDIDDVEAALEASAPLRSELDAELERLARETAAIPVYGRFPRGSA